MGLLRALRLIRAAKPEPVEEAPREQARGRSASFSIDVPAEVTGLSVPGGIAPRISRREALQVPAVLRARNLVCGTLSGLPIRFHDVDGAVAKPTTLLDQIDPAIVNVVTMAQTYEDLFFESVAWWRVTRFGWHGYPEEAIHVPVESVHIVPRGGFLPSQNLISPDLPWPVDGQVFIDGVPVPDREIIRFDSPNPPLLEHAARAIRTCLRLDQTAGRYADDPLPLGYFTDLDGQEPLEDEEVETVLDGWEESRRRRTWGYVGGLKAEKLQFDAEQIQLADQRQHAVLEIARASGIDPEDLGVSVTSRTYQNGEARRLALLDFTLAVYLKTVEQRLSMRDVTPRGYEARGVLNGFLRSDSLTRMQVYKAGLEVGAYTEEEVREEERKPPLKPSQRTAPQPPLPEQMPQPVPAQDQPEEPAMSASVDWMGTGVSFTADEPVRLQFASDDVAAAFQVDAEKRTIIGLAVPWNEVAQSGYNLWQFAPDSLRWGDVSRVKLNLDHDRSQLIGRATRLQASSRGLVATFKIANTPEGDRALSLAQDRILDGLSVEVDFDESAGDLWTEDSNGVRHVTKGVLRGTALTGMPAFDDARLTGVVASRTSKETTVKCTLCGHEHAPEVACTTVAPAVQAAAPAPAAAATAPPAPAQFTLSAEQMSAFTAAQGEAIVGAIREAFQRLPMPQYDAANQTPVPAGRAPVTVSREAPVYAFTGNGPSFVRDVWNARVEGNGEANERLRKYRSQQQEMVNLFASRPDLAFAVNTGNASSVIPPGYRPDLYVTQLLQGRPLFDAVSKGTLTDATPFTLPKFVSATGATADHVEGTNPTGGSMVITTTTVTPGGISGKYELTREIIDSSNPAIDQIAFAAMRESYSQQCEAKVYAELNGANGQGGVITNGFVPSGAQVSTTSGAGNTGFQALIAGTRAALALYPFRRFGEPNQMHLSQEATSAYAQAVGSDGRPLLPSVNAQNTVGLGNALTQGWFVDGLAARPTWSMTGNAAGDADVLGFNSMDVWAWESPLLTFRFEEKNGPANVELALFAYFATRILRPVSIFAIRHTAA